ncbi:MAG: GTPase HflX [Deltaproteobacteria bacterium]|nr:GTPase HflX [Deltaproteobacteria bacterium]
MPDLYGNLEGLKSSQVKSLKALYERRLPQDRFVTPELARRLTELARELHRQLGVTVDRVGFIEHVIVGDAHQVFIPDLGRSRAGEARFRGLRLIVAQLRGEGITKDNLTDLGLLRLDTIVTIAAGIDGLPGDIEYAYALPPEEARAAREALGEGGGAKIGDNKGLDDTMFRVEKRPSVHRWEEDYKAFIDDLEARFTRSGALKRVDGRQRAILVAVSLNQSAQEARLSLEELERLTTTAGLEVVDRALQVRREADNRTLIGKGKLQELLLKAMHLGAEVLIFDGELSPSQLRNIATETELAVLDRTQLILDIFAQRATTREGKLQVELAQLRYRKPRLAIMPTAMSRLTGGIGGRGPGETKLEINRRRADERLDRVAAQLKELGRQRGRRRDRRKRVNLPLVAICGYTNAGKSTLLNTMTNAKVDAEDKLFATLDPTSRRMRFPEEREVILTDTVGFIRRLPKELIEAFRSTLEEVVEADLLLHVVDAASDEKDVHMREVDRVLKQLDAHEIPRVVVFNKADQLSPEAQADLQQERGGLLVSALTREGLDTLLVEVERQIFRDRAAKAKSAQHDDQDDEEIIDPESWDDLPAPAADGPSPSGG